MDEVDRGMVNKIDVGHSTIDEVSKLDSNPDEQFSIDPFFQKTRSMFDSSTSKGLLLNCFEVLYYLNVANGSYGNQAHSWTRRAYEEVYTVYGISSQREFQECNGSN
jgi:hypothetical protein